MDDLDVFFWQEVTFKVRTNPAEHSSMNTLSSSQFQQGENKKMINTELSTDLLH